MRSPRVPLHVVLSLVSALCAFVATPGCADGEGTTTRGETGSTATASVDATPVEHGRTLFETPVGGIACAQCHSTATEDHPVEGLRFVGHSLRDATRRPSWWQGSITREKGGVRDAVLTCVARFQQRSWNMVLPRLPEGGRDLLAVEMEDAAVDALVAYLESLARPGDHPPLLAKKDDGPVALRRVDALAGDRERGLGVWSRSCAVCHGADGTGGLGSNLRGDMQAPDRWHVIEYVRCGPTRSQREGIDAWMPWFSPDVLPDQDLADVATLLDGDDW